MSRILHVFRPRTGGTFGHVRVLTSELASRGHEVAVCGPPAAGPERLPSGFGAGFEVPFLPARIPRGASPLEAGVAIRDLGRVFRSFDPDLIHLHGAQAGVAGRLARAARPAVPVVHTPHRYAFEDGSGRGPRNLAFEGIERALMPLATRVLCVCEAEREIAERLGAGGRARVVHNGIVPLGPASAPANVQAFAAGGRLIVAISELFPRKGVEVLLEAMPRVFDAHPDVRLVLAGDGPRRTAIEDLRTRLGLGDRVLLAGHVEGVSGLLEAADAYVNPALAEAFPYGVLEAMAAGLPCVVTDAGGTAEAVVDGESGVVVPTADAGALAGAVDRVLRDPGWAGTLGQAARDRVLTRFTRERMIAGTLAVYGELGVA